MIYTEIQCNECKRVGFSTRDLPERPNYDTNTMREELRKAGWKYSYIDGEDFCPECAFRKLGCTSTQIPSIVLRLVYIVNGKELPIDVDVSDLSEMKVSEILEKAYDLAVQSAAKGISDVGC